MSLRKKQSEFVKCVTALLVYGDAKGYEFTFGDAYRDPRVHGEVGVKLPKSYSHPSSVHKSRLAIDLNLFVDGAYISDGNHPAYQDLGAHWKTLHPMARWGGDFRDANHFSFEHNGFR